MLCVYMCLMMLVVVTKIGEVMVNYDYSNKTKVKLMEIKFIKTVS